MTMALKNRHPLPTLGNQKEAERRRLRFRPLMQAVCQRTESNGYDMGNKEESNRLAPGSPRLFQLAVMACLIAVHSLLSS